MGRSVSVPRNAEITCYRDVSDFGYRGEDEAGNTIDNPEYDEIQGQVDWKYFVEDIKETCKSEWKSLSDCDEWLGREDHAILENDLVYIGVSEYCGCASIWIVPKESDYTNKVDIAKNWIRQIRPKFEKYFSHMTKFGTFANGESVYRKKGE